MELAYKCHLFHRYGSDNAGIAHLLLGYKDVNKETIWLYAYCYQYGGHHVLAYTFAIIIKLSFEHLQRNRYCLFLKTFNKQQQKQE